jgi:multiple sugar transport system ATP-binding protein
MGDIRFEHVRKVFGGGVEAVKDLTITIPSPTLAVVVGPSGCGKTTVLRLLAGLAELTSGEIHLGSQRIDTLPARERDVAMVFQSYALYPHMTVRENLSFGLGVRKMPKEEINRRVAEVSKKLEIADLLGRRPGEISGGQRQRVALGRAIVREPRVFLFDEPLSSLDARLRMDMRYMIRKLYNDLQTTTIYVTHDQVEAMTIGEMLIVMKDGIVHQTGTPEACYHQPADTFVASFLGSPPMNLMEADLDPVSQILRLGNGDEIKIPQELTARFDLKKMGRVILGVRPERMTPMEGECRCEKGCLRLKGNVVLTEPLGYETLTHIAVGSSELIVKSQSKLPVRENGFVEVCIEPAHVHCFSPEDGRRLAAS